MQKQKMKNVMQNSQYIQNSKIKKIKHIQKYKQTGFLTLDIQL